MPLNHFIQPNTSKNEQKLIDNLIVEAIKIAGIDVYYLPKTRMGEEDIHNEIQYSKYNDAYLIEVFLKNLMNFEGEGMFLAKFGLEIRDQMVLTMAQTSFDRYITEHNSTLNRPREGDVIYIPMIGAAYEIKFVDPHALFFQLGALQVYDITCELVEFSNEVFNTGIKEIDDKYNAYSTDLVPDTLEDEAGEPITTEGGEVIVVDTGESKEDAWSDADDFENLADELLDFDENHPFGEP